MPAARAHLATHECPGLRTVLVRVQLLDAVGVQLGEDLGHGGFLRRFNATLEPWIHSGNVDRGAIITTAAAAVAARLVPRGVPGRRTHGRRRVRRAEQRTQSRTDARRNKYNPPTTSAALAPAGCTLYRSSCPTTNTQCPARPACWLHINQPTFTHSLTHARTHSLTHSLTHLFTFTASVGAMHRSLR